MPGEIIKRIEIERDGTIWVVSQEYYGIEQVAKMFGVHRRRIDEAASLEEDPLPFRCFPGQQRGGVIHADDLYRWYSEHMPLLRDEHREQRRRRSDGNA